MPGVPGGGILDPMAITKTAGRAAGPASSCGYHWVTCCLHGAGHHLLASYKLVTSLDEISASETVEEAAGVAMSPALLGIVHQSMNNVATARQAFQDALRLDPNNSVAQLALHHLPPAIITSAEAGRRFGFVFPARTSCPA